MIHLKKQALERGVNINFGKTIPIRDSNIIATGADPNSIWGIAKGIIFKTEHKDIAVGIINRNVSSSGYGYFLVVNGHGCVVTCMMKPFRRVNDYFNQRFKIVMRLFDPKISKKKMFGGFISINQRNDYIKNGSFYVGNAAGLQDLFSGFGMRYAIRSGFLAAKHYEDGKYDTVIKSLFKRNVRASLVNRYMWNKHAEAYFSMLNKKPLRIIDRFLKYLVYRENIIHHLYYGKALKHTKLIDMAD